MRNKLVLILLALFALTSNSFAMNYKDSSYKTLLQTPINGFNTGAVSGNITLLAGQGMPITGISVSNGATAGIISIYDATNTSYGAGTAGAPGPLECIFESQIAASTGSYIDLSGAPINTNSGVVVLLSGTVGAVIYTGSGNANR